VAEEPEVLVVLRLNSRRSAAAAWRQAWRDLTDRRCVCRDGRVQYGCVYDRTRALTYAGSRAAIHATGRTKIQFECSFEIQLVSCARAAAPRAAARALNECLLATRPTTR
jgi:hypothetical protein